MAASFSITTSNFPISLLTLIFRNVHLVGQDPWSERKKTPVSTLPQTFYDII